MKVELLASAWCQSCRQAEQVWQIVAAEKSIDFAVVDATQPEGREIVSRLRIKTVPALIIDGELRGVGVTTLAQAREWTASSPARTAQQGQNVGILMSEDNRWFVASAMMYLMLGGLGLVINGALLSDGPARPVALHLVTIGFMLMLLYGLGAHMLPRFTANPIRTGFWPWLQMGLAHCGVIAYAAGFLIPQHGLIVAGGAAVWTSLWIFLWRLWPVLWPKPTKQDGIVLRVHEA
uniref:Thioredoxin-like fold domain-containing protein n=1 Tax=mine drainage metagenome TaxID=410659 RepID=E6QTK0_9ZZZZ